MALASGHFFSGYRIDVDAIGALLHARDILFSVDAIQTLGAFPLSVEHIDFLSADAHKWLLGPLAIGIVYVKKARFELLRPTLLGAWNVRCPHFITQDEIVFAPTAQRYEPGVLNIAGVYGLKAAIDLFNSYGMSNVTARLLELKRYLLRRIDALGFEVVGPRDGMHASNITTFRHPHVSSAKLFTALEEENVIVSLRKERGGSEWLRFSPHFYNTEAEIDRAVEILRAAL